jgi:ABC-type glycerol-3-phosphate transport system substrate-binding protein
MKRVLVILCILAIASTAFANGKGDRITLTVAGLAKMPHYDAVVAAFEAAHPGVVVRRISYDIGSGSTIALDALIASGSYPNALSDFTGRVGKYAKQSDKPGAWSALDLKPFLGAQYGSFYDLKPFERDGRLLMMPETSPAQGFAINATLAKQAGYTLPGAANWTLAEFEKMATAVAKVPGTYPTILFAKNQSADYLWVNWFGSFGVKFFTPDHKHALLGQPALDAFRYLAKMYANGWVPKEAPELWDDAALEQYFAKGIVGGMGIRADWFPGYQKMGIDQGFIKEPFDVVMYPFPRAPGVAAVPSVGTGNTFVVCQTGNAQVDALAAQLVVAMVSKEAITESVNKLGSGFPVRKDVTMTYQPDPVGTWQKSVLDIVQRAGMMDVGYTLAGYADIRAILPSILQDMFNGKISPEQAVAQYGAAIDKALAQ